MALRCAKLLLACFSPCLAVLRYRLVPYGTALSLPGNAYKSNLAFQATTWRNTIKLLLQYKHADDTAARSQTH